MEAIGRILARAEVDEVVRVTIQSQKESSTLLKQTYVAELDWPASALALPVLSLAGWTFAASRVAPEPPPLLPLPLLLLPLLDATVLELPTPAATELPEPDAADEEDAAAVLLDAEALLPDVPEPPLLPPPPKRPPRM